jgi:hypothetical protein
MEEQVVNQSEVQPQGNPQAQGYRDPAVRESDTSPEKLGGYVGMMLLSMIPVVNIVMFLVWGFGSHNVNRRNFGWAALIVFAILFVLGMIFSAAILSFLLSFLPAIA